MNLWEARLLYKTHFNISEVINDYVKLISEASSIRSNNLIILAPYGQYKSGKPELNVRLGFLQLKNKTEYSLITSISLNNITFQTYNLDMKDLLYSSILCEYRYLEMNLYNHQFYSL